MSALFREQTRLQTLALKTPSGPERIKVLARLQLLSIEITLNLKIS